MTEKIYINPKTIETTAAKVSLIEEALDMEIDTSKDIERKDIYSPSEGDITVDD